MCNDSTSNHYSTTSIWKINHKGRRLYWIDDHCHQIAKHWKNYCIFYYQNVTNSSFDDYNEVVEEDDLKSRYVLPMIQSLFDNLDSENVVYFKITNENNPECKHKAFSVSRRRPDE